MRLFVGAVRTNWCFSVALRVGGAVENLQLIRLSISLACDVFRKLNPQSLTMQTIEFFQ